MTDDNGWHYHYPPFLAILLRPLAEELRINRNTIAKAYAELESQGIIETIHGKGYFLRDSASPLNAAAREKLLLTEIDEAVVIAHHLQVSRERLLKLVTERIEIEPYFTEPSSPSTN